MFAASAAVNLNAAAAAKTYGAQTTVRASQFSFSLQSAQVSAGTDSAQISDAARELANKSYSETIFFSLFGIAQTSRSGAASGLLDLFGVSDASGADASFHGGRYKTLDEVGRDFFGDFSSLTGVLDGLFSRLDLDGASLSFRLDGRGGVTTDETGDAARKATDAFNGNSTLVARFAVMAARGALVDAAESAPGFEAAYNENPPEAIKQYIDQLSERLFDFRLGYDADGFSATVDGKEVAGEAA